MALNEAVGRKKKPSDLHPLADKLSAMLVRDHGDVLVSSLEEFPTLLKGWTGVWLLALRGVFDIPEVQ